MITVGKCASFKPYISKTPQLAPTPPPKRQQHNHLHQNHLNTKFSQHSIFSTCRNSIVHFLTSAAETSPKERRSKSRCMFSVSRCFLPNKGRWLNHLKYQLPLRVTGSSVTFRVVGFFVARKRQFGSLYFGNITT